MYILLKQKIEVLREKLNKELEAKGPDNEQVLKLSQELDELIVEYCLKEIEKNKTVLLVFNEANLFEEPIRIIDDLYYTIHVKI